MIYCELWKELQWSCRVFKNITGLSLKHRLFAYLFVSKEYEKGGLEISYDRTQYMVIWSKAEGLEKNSTKQRDEYYSRIPLTNTGSDEMHIKNKIKKVKSLTWQLYTIIWNNDFTNKSYPQIFETIAESCSLCGSEIWVANKKPNKCNMNYVL